MKDRGIKQEFQKAIKLLNLDSELSSIINYWVDTEGNILHISSSCKRIIGYSKKVLLKNPSLLNSMIFPEDIKRWNEHFKIAINNKAHESEFRIIKKNGTILWVNHTWQKVVDENGNTFSYRGTITDISEKKTIHEINKISPTVFFVWENKKGWYMSFVSENIKELTGYTKSDFLNKKILYKNIISENDLEQIAEEVREFSNRDLSQFEHKRYRIIAKSGITKWVRSKTQVIKNIDGEIISYQGSVTDITPIIKAKIELKKSKERFKRFSDLTNEGILIHRNGFVVDMNLALVSITGFTEEELLGKDITKLFISPSFRKTTKELFNKKNNHSYELEGIKKDGSIIQIEIESRDLNYEENGEKCSVTIIRDISEKKKANDQINFLSLITKQSGSSVTVTNLDFKIIWINNAFKKLYGYSDEDVIGQTPDILNSDPTSKTKNKEIYRMLSEGRIYKNTLLSKKKDGAYFYCETEISPLYNQSGNIFGYSSYQKDVTDRKRMENALSQSELRFKAFFNASFEAVFFSENGIGIDQNHTAEVMFGYSLDECIGKKGTDWIAPEDRELVKNKILSGDTLPYQVTALRKNGTTFPCEIQARMITYKNRSIRVTALRDITYLKEIENSLQKSEELYKNIFQRSPLGIFHFDTLGNVKDCNNEHARIIGLPREKLIGLNLLAKVKDNKLKSEIKKTLKIGSGYYQDDYTSIQTKKRTPVKVHINAIYNAKNEIIGGVALVEDLTEQVKADENLKTSEERLNSFLNSATEAFALYDSNFNLIMVNDIAIKIISQTAKKEEILGKNIFEISPEIKESDRLNQYKKVLKTGKPLDFNNISISTDFGKKFLSVKAFSVGDGLGVIFVDVTKQTLIEKKLRSSEEKYRTLFEKSDDAIIIIDNNKFSDCNKASINLFGCKSKKELLMSSINLLSPEKQHDRALSNKKFKKMVEVTFKVGSNHFEWKFKRIDGEQFYSEVWLTAIPFEGKRILHMVCRDITERKRVEEYNTKLLNESQNLIDLKSNFISTVSHEFRTPLSVILTSSEMLELFDEKWGIRKKEVHYKRIRRNINSLIKLLDEASFLEKSSRGNNNIVRKPFDVVDLTKEIIDEVKSSMEENAKVVFSSNRVSGEIISDKQLIRRIILNLLTNALKYTHVEKSINVKIYVHKNFIKFIIADQGIGIPIKDQSSIYKEFFRADNVGTISGTGMGLSIVKEAAKALNGVISFTSKVDFGTTFEVKIFLNDHQ